MSEFTGELLAALQLLFDVAQKAAAVTPLKHSADGRKEYWNVDGELVESERPPTNREHVAKSIEDLAALTDRFAAEDAFPVVWHDADVAVLVVDDCDRRDRIALPLMLSPQWRRLCELAAECQPMEQAAFIDLLRIDLAQPADAVAVFRRVTWKTGANTGGDLAHGNEKLGKEIMAAVTGAEDLPEEIRVVVPVYASGGPRAPVTIRCAIKLDPNRGTFALVPFPGELPLAMDMIQVALATTLRAMLPESVPVYYGMP